MPMKYSSKKKFQSAQQSYVDFPPKHADTVSNALYNMQLQITAQLKLNDLSGKIFFSM